MRRVRLPFIVLALFLTVTPAAAGEPKTVFEHAQDAWVIATVRLSTPLAFREGRLLVFPAVLSDHIYVKREGRAPRNIMLVYSVAADEIDEPFYKQGDSIVAPIRVLPQHSYWRDNLPKTSLHSILGGRRNSFRDQDVEEAKKILGAYAKVMSIRSIDRWGKEIAVVVSALESPLRVFREDAVRFLAKNWHMEKSFPAEARAGYAAFISGAAPQSERITLIETVGRWKIALLADDLEKLAARDEPTAAAALMALDELGRKRDADQLHKLIKAGTPEVRAYAYREFGRRAGEDETALKTVAAVLDSTEQETVRAAAAQGLGLSAANAAIAPLVLALEKGDSVSRVAAQALAAIGGNDAAVPLKKAIVSGSRDAANGAVFAMPHMKGCEDCAAFMAEQYKTNPSKQTRDWIAIALEMELPREH